MKFTCSVSALREALVIANYTLDKRKDSEGSLLYLESVAGKKPRVFMFSTCATAMTLLRVAATVERPGNILIQPRLLEPVLATLPPEEEVTFERKEDKDFLSMKAGKVHIKRLPSGGSTDLMKDLIKCLPLTATGMITIPVPKLRDVIDRTLTFAYKGEDYNGMQNLFLQIAAKKLEAYTTNRNVLAHASIELDTDQALEVNIPAKSVPAMKSILQKIARQEQPDGKEPEVRILVGTNSDGQPSKFFVRTDDVFYGGVLCGYQFPKSAIGGDSKLKIESTVMLNREEFMGALNRAKPFCKDQKWVDVELKDNAMTLKAGGEQGEYEDQIAGYGKNTGEGSTTLNSEFLIGALSAAKEEIVNFHFTTVARAVYMESGIETKGRSSYVMSTAKADKAPAKPVASAPAAAPEPVAAAA